MENPGARSAPVIRGVFFDLDGTLYDRDAAILEMAERQFETFRSELADIPHSDFIRSLVRLDAHGHRRATQFHHRLAEELGFSNELADRLEEYFRVHYPGLCQLPDDTLQTLKALRAQGLKLGLITNGPTIWQERKITSMGIAPLLDTLLISGSEGIEKPDPRIFARALERCDLSAGEAIFVGDNPDADIRGAQAAGLRPVWKRMGYWSVPADVATIDRISEILLLIG
jgi:putative hydrolase of the HAD superfamily